MNIVLPSFSQKALRAMDSPTLLELLTIHEDRLPRSVVDECARRGEAVVPALRTILEDDANWRDEAGAGQWWSLLHAFMILGAIPGPQAAEALLAGFRRMADTDENESLWDWLAGYWPALFRNKREHVQAALRAIASDDSLGWYLRIQALECLLEAAQARGGEALENCLDWILEQARDPRDEADFRGLAGALLLNFPRERHRHDLERLAADLKTSTSFGPVFDRNDVCRAFEEGRDQPDWERFSDPWQFYDEEAIRQRQARWAREAAEEEAQAAAELAELQARQPIQREAPKVGRNEPCPCGSGKKYKKCCLNKAGQKPADLTWHRLRRVLDGLPQQMLRFADEILGPGAVKQAWTEFSNAPDHTFSPDNILIPVFMPWFFYHWRPRTPINGHATLAEAFLAGKPGRRLDPLARRYIEATIGAPFSFYDVKASRPGQGMTLHDILTGEAIEVTEHSASQTMRPGDILLAQPVRLDNLIVLESCGPIVIPPHAKQPIVQWRKELRAQHGVIGRDTLRDLVQEVLDLYQDLVAQLTDTRLPEIQNTDGDPLRPQELIFDIDSPQAAFDALYPLSLEAEPQSLLADAEHDDRGRLHKVRFPWLKKGNARHKSWQNTILGEIAIEGNRLTLHVNSDERAARIKEEVERRLGSQAHYRSTVLHSVEKLLEENKTSTQEPEPLPPELQEKLVEIMEAHWDQWIHEKIPALGDMTPLEAAKDPDGRELLEALLNDIQRKPAPHPQLPPDYDPVPALRARLGLLAGS